MVRNPSWETVLKASSSFASTCRIALAPPRIIVVPPQSTTIQRHTSRSPKIGDIRAISTMPAFTIVAECRYALTGVGAAIAPGSQKWNGNCADFVNAPTSTRTAATVAVVPAGGSAANSANELVPASTWNSATPARRHRPPPPVTTRARNAAVRA